MNPKPASFAVLLFALAYSTSAQIANVWQKANLPALPWVAVASSPDGTKLVAVPNGGGTVHVSTNGGASWTATSFSLSILPGRTAAISADGQKIFLAGLSSLYVSVNGGANWTERLEGGGHTGIACSTDGTRAVTSVSGGRLWTSVDSGTNWTMRAGDENWIDVGSSSDGLKLVSAIDGGKVYTSTNGGTNWSARADNQKWSAVASSANGSKLTAATSGDIFFHDSFGQLYQSTDSGTNWLNFFSTPTLSWSSVASSSDGARLVAIARSYGQRSPIGVICTSTNSGATRELAYAPTANWRGVASSADGTKLIAVDEGVPGAGGPGAVYTYSAPSTNAPALTIATAGGNGVLSWPWPSTGFVLQQKTNLSSTNWVNVSNALTVVNQVVAPTTNANNFYQLFKP